MLALADMAADKNPRGGAFEDLEANELRATFFEFRSRVPCRLEEISNSRRKGDRLRETSVGGAHRQPAFSLGMSRRCLNSTTGAPFKSVRRRPPDAFGCFAWQCPCIA